MKFNPGLLDNRDFMLKAVAINPQVLVEAPREIVNDPEIRAIAVRAAGA